MLLSTCTRYSTVIARRALAAPVRRRATSHQTSSVLLKPRLNYRDIADNVAQKTQNVLNRKVPLPPGAVQDIVTLWKEYKDISLRLNAKRNERAIVGEKIRQISSSSAVARERGEAIQYARRIKQEVADLETLLAGVEDRLLGLALALPNDTHPSSPVGPETAATTLSTHGPPPMPASLERDHLRTCRALDIVDLEAAAIATGSSWYYLKREGALLEIALTNYALSVAIQHGFMPVITPDVVRADIAARCGFHPRDHPDSPVSQMYHITSKIFPSDSTTHPELVLAGTAEIPLAALFANKILSPETLPLKVVGLGRAFRAEAGARGADTRGLYRVHQFTKVELFAVTREEESQEMMDEIRKVQVQLFEGLRIPFRVLDMPTEELGASAYRKYDMEAWMPGRAKWGEISSTSNCTDYQSRRLHIRYRHHSSAPSSISSTTNSSTSSMGFAHTLNGTAAAIPRLIVALLENGARLDANGSVIGLELPATLRAFWLGGRDIIQWIES